MTFYLLHDGLGWFQGHRPSRTQDLPTGGTRFNILVIDILAPLACLCEA